MITATLRLYAMEGLFYKALLRASGASFEARDIALLETVDSFDRVFDPMADRHCFSPVCVDGITEYISGSLSNQLSFVDATLTVWVLLEEAPLKPQCHE